MQVSQASKPDIHVHGPESVFLISLYDASLAQRASYFVKSSLFGPVVQAIMIILSLTALILC